MLKSSQIMAIDVSNPSIYFFFTTLCCYYKFCSEVTLKLIIFIIFNDDIAINLAGRSPFRLAAVPFNMLPLFLYWSLGFTAQILASAISSEPSMPQNFLKILY